MNAKTSKLIRRFCVATGQRHRVIKREYKRTPRNLRHAAKEMMKGEL